MVGQKKVYLVGTVHVSEGSVKKVDETIRTILPDMVCVELDRQRYQALIKFGEGGQFRYSPTTRELMSLPGLLRWIQQEIGKEFGVMPGAEMMSAVKTARAYKLNLGLIDRPVQITIARMLNSMKFKEKMKLFTYVCATGMVFLLKPIFGKRVYGFASMFGESKELDIKKLEKGEGVDDLMVLLKQQFPSVYKTLVEERNVFMCNNILHILQKVNTLVVVVGMGHVTGMKKILESKGVEVVV